MKRISVKSTLQTAFIILTMSALSACGFHLRGNYLVPQEISSISLTSFDQFSQLTRDVDAQLRLNNIELLPPSASIPNLHLVNESIGERTLSLYQNSKAAEIELTYTTSFRVTIPDVGSKTYTTNATRNYLDNPRTALAKSVERDLIVDEMRKQTSTQIMRQLARLKADIDSGFTEFDPIEDEQSANNAENQ